MKKIFDILVCVLLCCICLGVFGCNNDDGETGNTDTPTDAEITAQVVITGAPTETLIYNQNNYKFYLRAETEKSGCEFLWQSSNESVLTVNNGAITVCGEGQATVTVKVKDDEELTASVDITTKYLRVDIHDDGMPTDGKSEVGDEFTLTASVSSNDGGNYAVKWQSSDDKVLTVDDNGKVNCVGGGVATVKAFVENKTAAFDVRTVFVSDDGPYFKSVANNIDYEASGKNPNRTFRFSGGSDVADASAVDIATRVSLTAEHSYIFTCKFNVVNATKADGKPNIHWALNFFTNVDNYKAFTQFNAASNLGDSLANTYFGVSCENKAVSLSFDLSPAANVSNLVLRTWVHGTYLSGFDFEISDLKVIDKADGDFVSDVMGATVNTTKSNLEEMLNRNAYSAYVIDDDLYGTGNKYGILMDKKADEGDANPLFGARYKLNTGMETGKKYNITFTVIDLGIRKQASTGKMFYTCFGLQGEKLGGSSDYVSLDTYISGGYVTTDTINDITVYTITINDYTALKSVDNANFYIYISTSRAAQKFILTGIAITDISSGDEL